MLAALFSWSDEHAPSSSTSSTAFSAPLSKLDLPFSGSPLRLFSLHKRAWCQITEIQEEEGRRKLGRSRYVQSEVGAHTVGFFFFFFFGKYLSLFL